MKCEVRNISFEEVKARIKNRETIYTPQLDQERNVTLSFLDNTNSLFKVDDQINKYVFIKTGEVAFEGRVTDAIKEVFKRSKGEKEAERISNIPDNITKRKAGTFIHKLAQGIIDYTANGKGSIGELKTLATTGEYAMSKDNFDNLVRGVNDIINQIKKKQSAINKRYGTDEKVIIRTEQIVVDPIQDMGGSIDVVALFSDNTASVYDFKTIVPYSEYTSGFGENAKLIREIIPFYKEESYRLQMSDYKRILRERYGIDYIRESRVIPIHLELKLKEKKNREKGNNYSGKIALLEIGESQSEFLTQLPLGFEKTGIGGLDTLIQKQLITIDKLKDQQKKKIGKDEWEKLQLRIDNIKKALSTLYLKRDFTEIYTNIRHLIKEFDRRKKEERVLEDGSLNPQWLTTDDLIAFKDEFSVYSSIVELTKEYREYLAKTKKLTSSKLNTLILGGAGYISNTFVEINDILNQRGLDEINDIHKDRSGKLRKQKEIGWWKRIFGRLSEIKHPVFEQFKTITDKIRNNVRKDLDKLFETIKSTEIELFKWARNNDLSRQEAFDKLINKETGNLYSKLSNAFWKLHNKAFTDRDIKWIKANYEIRDFDKWKDSYDERLKQRKAYLRSRYNNFEDLLDERKRITKTGDEFRTEYERAVDKWIEANDLRKESAWYEERNRYWLKFKDGIVKANYSDEYKYILNNKPLHDYYEMYVKMNEEFRNILGLRYKQLPPNFIANIRKELLERVSLTNPGSFMREMIDSLSIREEDVHLGARNLETGELEKSIPIYYLNPFLNEDGSIKTDEKSYDLSKSLYLFGKMAYTYKYTSEEEAAVLALKNLLASEEELIITSEGKEVVDVEGIPVTKKSISGSKTLDLFNKYIDFYMYGIRFDEKGVTVDILGKKVNSTKALLAAKNYLAIKLLGLGVIPGTAAFIAGQTGVFLEGKKGITFTSEHRKNALKLMYNNPELYKAISKFFDIYTEEKSYRDALKLTNNPLSKWINTRNWFAPFRLADENIDNVILVSMSQNYGFDSNGNLRKLSNLPEGTKSVYDRIKYNQEKDKLEVEGITDEGYIAFRNAVREVSISIKGTMSNEDVNQTDFNLVLNLLMQFKTWMPGLLIERFGEFEYNKAIDIAKYGRYRAYFSEYEYVKGMEFTKYLKDIVAPNIGKLAFDIATFGIAPKTFGLQRVNKERARKAYEKWVLDNPVDAKNVTFDIYLEIKEKQIKAMMVEIRAILLLTSVIAFLGAEGDDGEPRYAQTWLGRQLYKTLNRGQSELTFAFTPSEFTRLIANPLPLSRLLYDVERTISNTLDETRDLITGENSPQDKTPYFYYSSQWIMGMSQFRRLIEMYEQDRKNPY